MRIIETKVYGIEEHPNKELCYDYIRNNWHDLNSYSLDEVVESLNALSAKIGGTVDHCISTVPDRSEFIKFYGYDHEALSYLSVDDLPLTGVCWDADVIEGLRTGNPELVLKALHSETEFMYSDIGLYDMCEANDYEFTEGGKFVAE